MIALLLLLLLIKMGNNALQQHVTVSYTLSVIIALQRTATGQFMVGWLVGCGVTFVVDSSKYESTSSSVVAKSTLEVDSS